MQKKSFIIHGPRPPRLASLSVVTARPASDNDGNEKDGDDDGYDGGDAENSADDDDDDEGGGG